ncbi:MAG: hypothetical protein M1820_006134 [Bogoriella megaspora]|nr:MAG: hypothetical protein M1820_006134 [Bogoriella megaspora]
MLIRLTLSLLFTASTLAQSSSILTTKIIWPISESPVSYTGIFEASILTAASNTTVYLLDCPTPDPVPSATTSIPYTRAISTYTGFSVTSTESFTFPPVPSPLPCSSAIGGGSSFTVTVGPTTWDFFQEATTTMGPTTTVETDTDQEVNTYTQTDTTIEENTISLHCTVSTVAPGVAGSAVCTSDNHALWISRNRTATPYFIDPPTRTLAPEQFGVQTVVVTAGMEKLEASGQSIAPTVSLNIWGVGVGVAAIFFGAVML